MRFAVGAITKPWGPIGCCSKSPKFKIGASVAKALGKVISNIPKVKLSMNLIKATFAP
jgi:hypothetical protein